MPLDDLINVAISADSTSPTAPGFGTICFLAGKVPSSPTFPSNNTVMYRSVLEMSQAGWDSTFPAYKCAVKVFSQKNPPNQFKVWKRTLALPVMEVTLKVLSAASGDVLSVKVNGTTTTITLDGTSGATTTAAAAALAGLIDDDTDLTVSPSSDTITISLAGAQPTMDGVLFDVSNWTSNIAFTNTTDYGTAASTNTVADDLDALLLADTDWYDLQLDSNSSVEIMDAAAWVENNKKVFTPFSNDSACFDSSSTTDVAYLLKAQEYARTALLFNGNDSFSYAGAAWFAVIATKKPGSYTMMYKTLVGIVADGLTGNQQTAIEDKNANTYTTVAGVNITGQGQTASGEYTDITIFIDWLRTEIQLRVFGRLVNLPKVPYTDLGVDIVRSEVLGALKAGVAAGGLDPGNEKDIPVPFCLAPRVADVSSANRANRHLPDVQFGARLAGAIHTLDINGVLAI